MRTTINASEEALDLAKEHARREGKTLGEVFSEAVLATLRERPAKKASKRPPALPVFHGQGLHPGVNLDRWADLEDVLDGR